MDDSQILAHIAELVEEEKRLRSEHHGLDEQDRARLRQLEAQLDQAWDLLRQRRAREDTGDDPEQAHERPVDEVESYLQ
jgi:hypothetical protein